MPAAANLNLRDLELMARATHYFDWQARLVLPELGPRVVEVGCGIGSFTRLLLERDAMIALDSDPECVERLRERYGNARNLNTLVCDVAEPAFLHVTAFEPDSCVCLNVLEHIDDDAGALRRMASVLVPGGVIVLLVPAFRCLYGEIDRRLGHYRRYRRGLLRKVAEAAGLRVRKLEYMNAPGFFGWWINAHLLHREEQSAAQIDFFDRCVVPAASRLERVVAPPFGQSLLAVLVKP